MSQAPTLSQESGAKDKLLFLGCFIALITTAFGFVGRLGLINVWAAEFHLDPAEAGRLAGIGIWPFAVSIIGFSLILDKIGYKVAMFFAFFGHIVWAIMGVSAYYVSKNGDTKTGYALLYWGSLILALGNGTVEAFINPVVATMFNKDKTKWLNILHAGWPGGLVITGLLVIGIDTFAKETPWAVKVGLIGLPAIVYFLILIGCKFPVQERAASGVSYRDMLAEFGILGAAVVGILITLQLMDFFKDAPAFTMKNAEGVLVLTSTAKMAFSAIGLAIVAAFGLYTRALGRPFMFFMVLIMMPLATTEIGTDGWITAIMEEPMKASGLHPGWVLVYTSAIMMVLRFFAGPIVHSLSPLGLLAISATLAIGGLFMLSSAAAGAAIFIAATLYGFGKTFFWPTMLGVVAEQTPKGGAMTLNAISGIGMIAVGVLGFPYIGTLQADKQIAALTADKAIVEKAPALVGADGKLTVLENKFAYEIPYQAVSTDKVKAVVAALPEANREGVQKAIDSTMARSSQGALANMIVFPIIMLTGYLILILYFKSKGGYHAQVLTGHAAKDAEYTGGVTGPADQ